MRIQSNTQTILLVLNLIVTIYLICQIKSIPVLPAFPIPIDNQNQGIWKIYSLNFAIISGTIATFLALGQSIWNIIQRQIDLRWKKAELARSFTDIIYDDKLSHDALQMLDEVKKPFSEEKFDININDIYSGLKSDLEGKDFYIRECFDSLLYYLERIEHSIELEVIKFEDVKSYCEYYVTAIQKHEDLLFYYCNLIRYKKAINFINRFKK
jgi:hypothetical protein